MLVRKRWGLTVFAVLALTLLTTGASQAQLPFSAPKNISSNSDYSFTPQLAVDAAGNIYAVWEDDTNSNSNILFSRSTDGGTTFSAPVSLSHTSGFSFSPRIAVDSNGGINVVWEDDSPGNLDVFFTRSADGGTTFSAPKNISNDSSDSGSPTVAADSNGNIYVVWENDSGVLGISFSRSTDGGANFSAPVILSTNTGGSVSPQIAVDRNGNVNLAWEDDIGMTSDVTFARSSDHGATFSAPKSLSLNVGNSNSVQVAVDFNGNINAVWENDSPGNFDIFFSRSTDGGLNFSTPQNVSNSPGLSRTPQLALDSGGNINVLWADNAPPNSSTDIFYARSANGGTSFSTPQNLSSNAGFSANPSLAIDPGGNINAVWEDSTPGNRDIFFSQSLDAGATFSAAQNLSNNAGLSSVALIFADSKGNLNVVWQDATLGPSQIFYSRFTNKITNHPPVADAGPDQNVQATGPSGASVTLDGSKSSDPDNDTLTYSWSDESNTVIGTTAVVQVTAPTGTHTFTLTVTDPGNLSSAATTHVTVTAPTNHPPVANAGANQNVGCTGRNGTAVTLNGSGSTDPDGNSLSYVWKDQNGAVVGTTANVQVTLSPGTYTFTLTVTDPGGLSSTATTSITVQDTTSPTLTFALSPNSLQPPNHKLALITATVNAADACSANTAVRLVSITSNEPDEGSGDGDQPNDIQAAGGGPVPFGTDVRSFLLRAERSGMGSGRIYTVTYSATDAAGNTTSASGVVVVGATLADPPLKVRHHDAGGGRDHDRDERGRNHDKKGNKDGKNKGHDEHGDKDRDHR